MKVYEISLADKAFELIPTKNSTERLNGCASDATRIYFYPTADCDFKIDAEYKNGAGPREIFAVLSFFFGQVRGLPECELSVMLDGRVAELKMFDTPSGYATVRAKKCKLLSANNLTFSDGTEHTVYTVTARESVRCMLTDDADRFDARVLSEMRVMRDLPDAEYALVVSRHAPDAAAKAVATDGTPICAAVCAAALITGKRCGTVDINGFRCPFDICPDGSLSVRLPARCREVRNR